jgi:hypothetical protein
VPSDGSIGHASVCDAPAAMSFGVNGVLAKSLGLTKTSPILGRLDAGSVCPSASPSPAISNARRSISVIACSSHHVCLRRLNADIA